MNIQLIATIATLFWLSRTATANFNLTVIHNNDFHTRYLPIKWYSYTECETRTNSSECVGGLARTIYQMKKYRKTIPNLLFLNAGDHFQGSFWYTIGKSKIVADFASLMHHDAMALGNHEFDDGEEELEKFITRINGKQIGKLPIISCNIVIKKNSSLEGLVKRSTYRKINETEVVIIGYTTPDTVFLASPGKNITFRDEIEAIQEEIARVKKDRPDLKIFIAVGHSGFERDKEIAKAIPELDLVVGGHSHSFLYTGTNAPSNEVVEGDYPYVVKHDSNKQTLVVQAFAYGKYMGKINLIFDDNGDIVEFKGEPVYLDASIPEDEETRQIVDQMNQELSEKFNEVVGEAITDLNATNCRQAECSLANVVADSFSNFFDQRLKIQQLPSDCNNTLALINGGNIRSGIDKGNITRRNIISALPFGNTLGILSVSGSELINIFEQSATQYRKGGFMQVSKVRVTYEESNQHATLKTLEVNCNNQWRNVDPNATYSIVLTNFIAKGGDNYTINGEWKDFGFKDSDTFDSYVKQIKTISGKIDNRIKFESKSSAINSFSSISAFKVILFIILHVTIRQIM